MKKNILLAVAFAFFFIQSACAQSSENRNVGDFDQVSIGGGYKVIMTKGSSPSVKLEGNQKDLDRIEVEKDGSTLKIKNKKQNGGWGWNKMGRVTIYITFEELKGLYSSGSSTIEVKSEVKANEFTYKGSGSGDTYIDLNVKDLTATITGSGSINLKGSTNNETFRVTGSGDIRALDLKAENANVSITGSGDIKVHATEGLEARITGSGDIKYKGDPKQNIKITGSGSIKRVD